MIRRGRPASLLALLLGGTVASGQDWPRFRGPDGAGLAGDAAIPVRWTDEDYHWR